MPTVTTTPLATAMTVGVSLVLQQLAQVVKPEDTLLFMCRSGARSHGAAAAATQAGWGDSYNVLEGFEGDKDAEQHRNTLGGWRKAGLPWLQG